METIDRLKIKLGIMGNDSDDKLNECLLGAEDELKAFLNVATLESRFVSKLIELAKLYYLRDYGTEEKGVKSESYSESGVSESVTYNTTADYEALAIDLLDSLKRYRRVYAHKNSTENSD